MQERADVVPKPRQLSSLFLGRGAVLRASDSLKEIRDRVRPSLWVLPTRSVQCVGPARDLCERPLRLERTLLRSTAAAPPPPGPFPYFPGLTPRLQPGPKHVPPPAPTDHAAARLRSRAPPRRPLARFLPARRRLAGGRGHAPSRERCILVCPRAPPRAAPSAAPRPSRAARRQNRAARKARYALGTDARDTAERCTRAASVSRRAPASQHCCLQAVRHHALAGLHRSGRCARSK